MPFPLSVKMQFAKNLQRFRLITFDITDTLLRFRSDPIRIYREKAHKFGFKNIDEKELRRCFRKNFKEMAQKYPNFGAHQENMTWEQWWIMLVKETFCSVDPNIDRKRLSELAEHLLRIFRTSECWSHIDCGKSLVQKVREIGKCVGVISNFDSSLKEVLQEMDIADHFDFILTSYDAGIQKPERGIFELALKQVNARPEEALHIGNSFELDYVGAKENSGWSSLLVTEDRSKIRDIKDEFVYANICDMLEALETKEINW